MTPASPRCRTVLLAVLASAAAAVWAEPARAQSAEAEMLFREGRRLIKAGKLEAGCDKLAASERLEPSVGTLLNLGDCREKLGRHASAWAAFQRAEALAKRAGRDDKRRREAARRAAQLEPKLAHLVIQVPHKVPGIEVRRDGEIVDPAAWNTEVPLDPDRYTIEVQAPGFRPWRSEVAVGGNLRQVVVAVPALERLPVARAPEPPAPEVAPAPPSTPPDAVVIPTPVTVVAPVREPSTWTASRKVAVGLAVVGVGALGGGIYFGMRANDLAEQSDELCPLTVCDSARGLELNEDARDHALRANLLYAGGGLAIVASVIAWVAGGPDNETYVRPTGGDGRVGVALGRRF